MYYVYGLKSKIAKHFYIGQTVNVESRFILHNNGKVKSTKNFTPWKLVFSEEYKTRLEAVRREKYLKSHAGRNWLKKYYKD